MKTTLRSLLLPALLLLLSFSFNDKTEFEGIIKYKHTVIPKDKSYDPEYDYGGIGHYSEYYYKDGDYKFVNHDSYFQADLFKSKEQRNYLVISNSDTVFCLNAKVSDADVVEYKVKQAADTILNQSCDLISITLKPAGKEGPLSFRRYYFSRKLPVNPAHFNGCKANAYDLIYENAKALPLRIEFEWPNRVIRWEAYEISRQPLSTDIFRKQDNWVCKNIN